MKKSSRFYHFCFLSFCGFFVLILFAFLFMQTETFQKELVSQIVAEAKKNNISLKIDKLHGLAPFKWSCEKATLNFEDGKEIELKKVSLRIAFFPLFNKQLSISFLRAHEVIFSMPSLEEKKSPFSKFQIPTLPFHIAAKTVQIKDLTLKDLSREKELHLSIMGKAKVDKNMKEVQFDLIAIEPILQNNLHIQFLSSFKKDAINAKVHLLLKNSQNLSSFLDLPLQLSLESSIRCWGKWSYWEDLNKKIKTNPLCFAIKSEIPSLSAPSFPFLNRKWTLDTELSLWPDLSSCCENFHVESNWLRILGKACFSSNLKPLEGSAILSIEDLKELDSFFSFPVSGKVDIKTGLKNSAFLLSLSSHSLEIGKEVFSPAEFKIGSTLRETEWQGKITCILQNKNLPWEGSSDFLLNSDKLGVQDLSLQAQECKISGAGEVDFKKKALEGSFFLLIPELRSFRSLFPHSDLEGKIGGSVSFSYEKNDLALKTHLIAKNVRYQSSLLSNGILEIDGTNIINKPQGLFSLECENLLTKKGQISKLYFSSNETSDNNQTYTLEAFGDWKQRFHLSSSGLWKKENANTSVIVNACEGTIFNQPFHMKAFSIEKEGPQFSLHDYSLQLGQGTLTAEVKLGDGFADIKTKASHLPLDIFTLFYPNIALYGKASLDGSFSGGEEGSKGYLMMTLEEGSLPNLQAKGSMQVHFNPKSAQIYTHLYATDLQFLDFTATLPICYQYNPFKIFIDPTAPLASEWTSQGNIDALFNFLQMPNQKTSGLLTSHFLLSGTPNTPYLNGEMDIQNGAYENYFIGIKGKNINGSFTASGSTLHLDSFSTSDKEEGLLKAKGSLLLNKKEGFPFIADLDLENYNLIQSNLFQTKTTGDLLIEGNNKGCKASGNLQIDAATFTLLDKLPQEVPTLPVIHINKPIHLQQSEILQTSDYPFNLDLHLTADNTIFIKGRGLDSEWEGNVILTGTPTKLVGNGSLTLKKGEFSFSGKNFALTKGDIIFSDKPEPEANLSLVGELRLPTATIIANLQGPLTSPKLTFQSIPGLPTSSILALILFNKDISEISPLQALQLAQVVMSLSGNGGPDVLGAIRKTIGVDKLNIGGKEGSDDIALQIGWCISHGITVSLSQSATSSDITIEVDLKNGLLFEAETQNQEEGKFSLKWNHNY